jgi:hypothetical protein
MTRSSFHCLLQKEGVEHSCGFLKGVPSSKRIVYNVTKVITSMVIVQAKLGVLVQGVGNRNDGVRHEPLGFKIEAKNPSGKRKSSPKDYGGKWTHTAAQDALAWKLEESRGVVAGTKVKQESKWSQKPGQCQIWIHFPNPTQIEVLQHAKTRPYPILGTRRVK